MATVHETSSEELEAIKKDLGQLLMEEQSRLNQDEFRAAAVD